MIRRKLIFVSLFLIAFILQSCSENHFLKDKEYREKVHEQFLKRKELAKKRSEVLFSVFDNPEMSLEEREALEFLYAYMPLTDLADYDGDLFYEQVKGAFKAREYFDWGKKVPDDLFRHFVLVHRSSNEYLDSARTVFFDELKDRVKGMSMYDAILEVNHWCHEKVTYRATDGRTSAPLALAKTSWGRCGEETVFTIAALRAVGIPARDAYTPRWVHTDNNHAWVEAWADGKWYYIGACEPEPELNMAWFTSPAQRSMMMLTNVIGLYNGTEEYNKKTDLSTTINLMDIYAPTRKVEVKVVDSENQPISEAVVKFNVYNSAEFYPIAESRTDEQGMASVISGFGDILVWANKDNFYGYIKSSPDDKIVTVMLDRNAGEEYQETMEMNPPKEAPAPKVSEEKIRINAVRLAHEDSIRNAYMSTFATEKDAELLALETRLDKKDIFKFLSAAQGNWKDIRSFIEDEKDNSYLIPFLNVLSEKDLRDTPTEYMKDHLNNGLAFGVKEGTPSDMIAEYILSPRIDRELITPWRGKIHSVVNEEKVKKAQEDVSLVIKFVKDSIEINTIDNYYNCRITPWGVYELGVSDEISRNIFFVALCRAYGIPARIERATSKIQYYENGNWVDVFFEKPVEKVIQPTGKITFSNSPKNIVTPSYGSHFSIARYEDGIFKTLNYSYDPNLAKFPASLTLDIGYYKYMVASRANDGSVTANISYFELKENENKTIEIVLPEPEGKMQVMGIVDMNSIIQLKDGNKKTLKELSEGNGVVLCFADPGKEPTKHILQELPAQAAALDEWGGGIVFMVPDDKMSETFDPAVFGGLPAKTTWSIDNARTLLGQITGALQIDLHDNFPLTLYLNNNGGILYYSVGYRIGIGENLVRTIATEKATMND